MTADPPPDDGFDPELAEPEPGVLPPDSGTPQFVDDLDDVYLDYIPKDQGGRA